MTLPPNRFMGMRHESTPQGTMAQIGTVKCYIATPKMHYPDDKVVLLFTDAFGLALSNMLLADDFARNGFKTVVPDILNDDPMPAFNPDLAPFDREKWLESHGSAQTRPSIDKVIAAFKHEGVTNFAATGYFFGARYAVDLAFENVVQVSVVSHLGQLAIPDHLEKYGARSKAPLLINTIPGGGMFVPGPMRNQFDAWHVRRNREKANKDRAFKDTMLPSDPRPHTDRSLGSEMFLPLPMGRQSDAVRVLRDRKKAGENDAFKDTVDWLMDHF
ncbi:hypothetical protein B0H19DRAFT_1040876 [Mycena capillaripes]|nr:hypothetical protein B0H19DRAFT_1040876 [Mycena capillaripes]